MNARSTPLGMGDPRSTFIIEHATGAYTVVMNTISRPDNNYRLAAWRHNVITYGSNIQRGGAALYVPVHSYVLT